MCNHVSLTTRCHVPPASLRSYGSDTRTALGRACHSHMMIGTQAKRLLKSHVAAVPREPFYQGVRVASGGRGPMRPSRGYAREPPLEPHHGAPAANVGRFSLRGCGASDWKGNELRKSHKQDFYRKVTAVRRDPCTGPQPGALAQDPRHQRASTLYGPRR